jgi:peptidoglycan/xylan/chitin deacetylase (PgdA/CDA1 family)
MAGALDEVARRLGRVTPRPLLRQMLAGALGELKVSLCMHRVSDARRSTDFQPELTMPAAELDALVELLRASRPGAGRWLTVTFDDGYADAAEYIDSRASRFPDVDFIFFLCPEKTERAAGFRWDLAEQGGMAMEAFHDALDVERENARPELSALAQRAEYRLATVAECQALVAKHLNVALGNHTNSHFQQTRLTAEQAAREYDRSQEIFHRHFGPVQHFAFPFGSPGREFTQTHVDLLRARGDFLIWSTERRPYAPAEQTPRAVLPRFPVRGNESASQVAAWIALRALVHRARGTRFHF